MAAARGRSGSGQSLEDLLGNEGTTATLVFNAIMTAAAQPLTCARLLVQVGHEPISPTEFTTFYQYACHVKKINGWHGLYRGLLPRVYSSMIGTLVNNTMLQVMDKKDNALVPLVPPENKSRQEELLEFFEEFLNQNLDHWEGTAVVNGEFKYLKMTDSRGKYLVFFFYPLDLINTPRKEGGLGRLKYPLLSDLNHQIAKDYGVLLENEGHTLRGLFIIDDKGTLRQITMNDLPVGRSVDETLRLVQAFQYTDKHGEVCPAGWKPGKETIIPDPTEKKKYFAKQTEGEDEEEKNKLNKLWNWKKEKTESCLNLGGIVLLCIQKSYERFVRKLLAKIEKQM